MKRLPVTVFAFFNTNFQFSYNGFQTRLESSIGAAILLIGGEEEFPFSKAYSCLREEKLLIQNTREITGKELKHISQEGLAIPMKKNL